MFLFRRSALTAFGAGCAAWVTGRALSTDILVARLREGGLVLFFRHADTIGVACDRSFRIGDRAGQRNISRAGLEQARRIAARLDKLDIPLEFPILAGPVYRACDTADSGLGAGRG